MPNPQVPEDGQPPGVEQTSDIGKGYKYMLVKQVLGIEPDEWIAQRRAVRPGSDRPGMSYSQIAGDLNTVLAAANLNVRVTHESIRRWDPAGEFLRGHAEPGAVPPAVFRPPGAA